jgi:hypothetical protein
MSSVSTASSAHSVRRYDRKQKLTYEKALRRDRFAIASYRRLLPATGLADCSIGASRRLEEKSLAELLDFERPGNRFSGPFPMRLPAKAQGCRHALLSKRARVVGIVKAHDVRRIFLFSFPAPDAKAKFSRRVSGLKIVVAPGRLTMKAGRSCYASIAILHGMFCKYCKIIPQKSRTFSKTFRFSRFMQFCSPLL